MYCRKCSKRFDEDLNAYWDEASSFGSVKLNKCPNCGNVNIVKYIYDRSFKEEFKYENKSSSDKNIDKYFRKFIKEKE